MVNEPTRIVEIELPAQHAYRFQCLLEGEEGLAVARSFDPEHKKLQLWTTPSQHSDLLDWLSTVSGMMDVELLAEWTLGDEKK